MALHHIRSNDKWVADANGHVIDERFFREFRRKGADIAVMSTEQFEGYFGAPEERNGEPFKYKIDQIPVVSDPNINKGTVEFYVGHELLGKIINLWFPIEKEDGKATEESH